MANFKLLENTIKEKYPSNEFNPEGKTTQSTRKPRDEKSSRKNKISEQGDAVEEQTKKVAKLTKSNQYEVNEEVKYFDRDSKKMEDATISAKDPPHHYYVINHMKHRSFRINESLITKKLT